MMNIRNLGPKESLGVKFKDGICTELYLKLWYFCNITESGWFSKQLFKKKDPNNHFPKSV